MHHIHFDQINIVYIQHEIYNEISNDAIWHRPTWKKIKKYKFLDPHLFDDENVDISNLKSANKINNTIIENCAKILEINLP